MTPDVLKAAAWVAWSGVIGLAFTRVRRGCGREIGLYDEIPRWYVVFVIVATIGLMFALGAAGLSARR